MPTNQQQWGSAMAARSPAQPFALAAAQQKRAASFAMIRKFEGGQGG